MVNRQIARRWCLQIYAYICSPITSFVSIGEPDENVDGSTFSP